MSYLPLNQQLGSTAAESEGRLERFIHLFASAVTLGELVVHRRQAMRSPVFWGAGLVAAAIMWRKV